MMKTEVPPTEGINQTDRQAIIDDLLAHYLGGGLERPGG